jgi:hypothetical protein
MGLLFFVVGASVLVSAIRGSQNELFQLLSADVPAVAEQVGAIVLIGLLGYIPGMQTPSRALLALVIIVVLLDEQGAWSAVQQTLATAQRGQEPAIPTARPVAVISPPAAAAAGSSSGGGSGAGDAIKGAGGLLSGLGALFGL